MPLMKRAAVSPLQQVSWGLGTGPQVTPCSRNSTGLLGTVLQGQLNFFYFNSRC